MGSGVPAAWRPICCLLMCDRFACESSLSGRKRPHITAPPPAASAINTPPVLQMQSLEPFYDSMDPDFVNIRKTVREVLQKEDDLNEIVQLVGKVGRHLRQKASKAAVSSGA